MRQVVALFVGLALASSTPVASYAAAPGGGTIAITAKAANAAPVTPELLDAIAGALTARGFTVLNDPDHVGYLAEATVSQEAVGTAMEKTRRESAGMIGSGAYLPLQSGGYTALVLRRTKLELSISKRGGGPVWRGAAVTVRPVGTLTGTDAAVARDLGDALLSGYPDQPEDTIGVP